MTVAVVIMTDGRRQYMAPAMASLLARVTGPIGRYVIHDDSGDAAYRLWLQQAFPWCEVIGPHRGRSGFCGAYASAWRWLAHDLDTESWIFQVEDDFVYNRDVDLQAMLDVMGAHPRIVQMQLRRQPWGGEPEGGFIAQWPHFYTDVTDGGHEWLEHQRNWSTNPGLFRRALCWREWPPPPGCEGALGDAIIADNPASVFAVWGRRGDAPLVHHIGDERVGHSY